MKIGAKSPKMCVLLQHGSVAYYVLHYSRARAVLFSYCRTFRRRRSSALRSCWLSALSLPDLDSNLGSDFKCIDGICMLPFP